MRKLGIFIRHIWWPLVCVILGFGVGALTEDYSRVYSAPGRPTVIQAPRIRIQIVSILHAKTHDKEINDVIVKRMDNGRTHLMRNDFSMPANFLGGI